MGTFIFMLNLLGFSPKVVKRLDDASKNQMVFGAFTVWLVAGLSALLFATTISNLCFEGKYFLGIAIIWFFFVYALDALVLGADMKSKTVLFIRVAICIILASFHSLTLDTFVFRKDIRNFLTRKYNTEAATLENTFQVQKISPLRMMQDSLRSRNQELFEAEKKSRDRVFEEIDRGINGRPPGRGQYAKYKEKIHAADSMLFSRERILNDSTIAGIDDQLKTLHSELNGEKVRLVKPEEAGLRDNMNALHLLVWGSQGTFSDRFYFILLILAGFMFESLVLISKLAFGKSFRAYQTEADNERRVISDHQNKKRFLENEVEEIRLTLEMQEQTSGLRNTFEIKDIRADREHGLLKAEERFKKTKDEATLISENIKDTSNFDSAMRSDLNGQYEAYGKPLVTEFRLGKIKKIVEDIKNDRA